MHKNIKITQKQYKMLKEADESEFSYVSDSNFKPFDGFGGITTDGKIDGEENAEENLTTDKYQKMRTMDGWNRYRTYGRLYPTVVREGVDITKKEDNTADDWGETDAFDDDRLEDPNRVQIPNTIKQRMKMFIDSINNANLNDAQKAVVLNNLLPHLTSNSTTYHSQKRTDKEIQKSKLNVTNAMKKNMANNA